MGFGLYHQGAKISVVTDLGHACGIVMQKIAGSDIILIESNHDEDMLIQNPDYSRGLKDRILSSKGHLSNAACAEVVLRLAKTGLRQVLLGHLSDNNNTPELAINTVRQVLIDNSIDPDTDIRLAVALQGRMSAVYEIATDSDRYWAQETAATGG